MLVLTRKRDESIMIGDHIKIVVVDVRGDQVKLGIEAPRTIPVHREEVYREIQEENRRAAVARAPISVEELERMIKEPPVVPAPGAPTPASDPPGGDPA